MLLLDPTCLGRAWFRHCLFTSGPACYWILRSCVMPRVPRLSNGDDAKGALESTRTRFGQAVERGTQPLRKALAAVEESPGKFARTPKQLDRPAAARGDIYRSWDFGSQESVSILISLSVPVTR